MVLTDWFYVVHGMQQNKNNQDSVDNEEFTLSDSSLKISFYFCLEISFNFIVAPLMAIHLIFYSLGNCEFSFVFGF